MTESHLTNPTDHHFLISAPRSGSTWLARAIGEHPDLITTESRLFGNFFELWKNNAGRPIPRITGDQFILGLSRHSFFESLGFQTANEMASDLFPQFQHFLTDYIKVRSGKSIIVDKVTPYLGTAAHVYSQIKKQRGAKIINLIRDGRDVAVSGIFDWIRREEAESPRYRFYVMQEPGARLSRFFDDERLERWAQYWIEPIIASQDNPSDSLEVRYEDMLTNQAAELERIFEFLAVQSNTELAQACADAVTFEKLTGRDSGTAEPLAKTRKGIAGDWRNFFTQRDAQLFQDLTGPWLRQLGYESDPSWIENCPESLELALP